MIRGLIAAVLLAAGLLGLPAGPALADSEYNVTRLGGIAIDGTDPVAYFTQFTAVTGLRKFSYDWKGATWRFASAANRKAFKADPVRYAPQYGGYCAWAVAQGYTAKIDPDAWKIVDYKLYLNYSKSVQRKWAADIPGNIIKADHNWPGIRTTLTNR